MKEVFVYKILIFALAMQISSAMNSDPNRQIVYEKCRGPGKLSFEVIIEMKEFLNYEVIDL